MCNDRTSPQDFYSDNLLWTDFSSCCTLSDYLVSCERARVVPCRYTALTSSEDGTVRVWDTASVTQKTVVKPTLAKPGRVTVSMARYSNDGHLILAGLNNGTLQAWDVRGSHVAT